ncbi:hypothetical protein ACYZDF_003935 [Escherichia coli]
MSNQPTSLPEEDIEFVMDTFQRSMGKSKPVRDTQEPRQPGGCKLKTAPVRPVVAARPAEYVCSEDLFY